MVRARWPEPGSRSAGATERGAFDWRVRLVRRGAGHAGGARRLRARAPAPVLRGTDARQTRTGGHLEHRPPGRCPALAGDAGLDGVVGGEILVFTTFPERTTIIYLDQNKWIDLSHAYHGMPEGQKFQHVLTKIQSAVSRKDAIFPLSFQHYFETNKGSNLEQRRRLAKVMAEISKGICISPQERMMQWELKRSLAKLFNEPILETPSAFGYGFPCALGLSVEIPKDQFDEAREKITSFETTFNLIVEDDSDEFNAWSQEFEITHNKLAGNLEKFREKVKNLEKLSRKHAYVVHLAIALQEEITEALSYFNKTPQELFSIGAKKLDSFWENVPTLHVEIELNVSRSEHWDRKIEPNDTTDIAFLNVAIPYCDVLVVEKYFHNLIKQKGLDKKYKTQVFRSINDLEGVLA